MGLFVDPTDTYTVLAPTNEAFADLLAALGANGLEDIPLETLTEVLAYHVIPSAAIFSTDLVDGAVVTTLGGAELTVDLTSAPGSVIFDGIGSDATVVIADVEAGNSVVHVIDAVLLPFSVESPVEEPAAIPDDSIAGVRSFCRGCAVFDIEMTWLVFFVVLLYTI